MKPDMTVTWKDHLKNGWIWKANVELAMEDVGESSFYYVDVYVVAPDANLAQYIVTTMYPEFESLSVDDEPVTPESYGKPTV
tara:strand:- start:262 stop:507 length:246 start_codon:yes stop_codon:yes gene_type:complete